MRRDDATPGLLPQPEDILAYQYDVVCNGVELSSGAIRNHKPEIMEKAFAIAGYPKEELETRFGGMHRLLDRRLAVVERCDDGDVRAGRSTLPECGEFKMIGARHCAGSRLAAARMGAETDNLSDAKHSSRPSGSGSAATARTSRCGPGGSWRRWASTPNSMSAA